MRIIEGEKVSQVMDLIHKLSDDDVYIITQWLHDRMKKAIKTPYKAVYICGECKHEEVDKNIQHWTPNPWAATTFDTFIPSVDYMWSCPKCGNDNGNCTSFRKLTEREELEQIF